MYFFTKTCIALLRNWLYSNWFSLIWFPIQHIKRREILICCNIYSFSCSQVTRLVLLGLGCKDMPNRCTQDASYFWCVCVCVRERETEQTTFKKKKEDLDKSNKPTNSTLNISLQTFLAYFGEYRSRQCSLNLLSFFGQKPIFFCTHRKSPCEVPDMLISLKKEIILWCIHAVCKTSSKHQLVHLKYLQLSQRHLNKSDLKGYVLS